MIEPTETEDFESFNMRVLEEHGYASNTNRIHTHVVEYIAGFVVFKLCKELECDECISAGQGVLSQNSLIRY